MAAVPSIVTKANQNSFTRKDEENVSIQTFSLTSSRERDFHFYEKIFLRRNPT
jgi:hypothetical protein